MYSSELSLLIFDPFLRDLKIRLGYSIDIGKLKQLIAWSSLEYARKGSLTLDDIKPVFRVLFLQNERDDGLIFEALFYKHFLAIDKWCMEMVENLSMGDSEKAKTIAATKPKEIERQVHFFDWSMFKEKISLFFNELKKILILFSVFAAILKWIAGKAEFSFKKNLDEPSDLTDTKKFLHTEIGASDPIMYNPDHIFSLNDSFLPVSYREMVQSWRQLRTEGGWKLSNNLDIPATVKQIARTRIADNLIFQKESVNTGEDSLVILVDRGGSMKPFHYLTDKVINAALFDGGHTKAKIYYFYNVPSTYVYKEPSLNDSEKLSTVLHRLNPKRSRVLIISDGGAFRGNRNKTRVEKTLDLLNGPMNGSEGLLKASKSVVWLNPMPVHRWYGTSAIEIIKRSNIYMFSSMDLGNKSLFYSVSVMLGKNL